MRSHSAAGERRLQGVVHGRKWSSHSPFMCKEKEYVCICIYCILSVLKTTNSYAVLCYTA